MEEINKELEKQLAEFDYLFQECVIFSGTDIRRFDILINKLSKLRCELKKHPSGGYVSKVLYCNPKD